MAERTGGFKRLWELLNRPLPGTQKRPEPVMVEGRITRAHLRLFCALVLLGLLAIKAAEMAGWIQLPAFDPLAPYFNWAQGMLCEAGWRGHSKGMLAMAAALLLAVLLVWLAWLGALLQARRLVRRQTNLPPSGKPWLPMRLIEGPAAVRQGRRLQVFAVLVLGLLLWISFALLPEVFKMFLIPPSAIKIC